MSGRGAGRWAPAARAVIARVHAQLPENATLKERRKALRAVGGSFHGGTCWGRKVWGRECRKYLLIWHPTELAKPITDTRLFAADICFPFREQPVQMGFDVGRDGGDFSVEAIIQDGRVIDFNVIRPERKHG